MLTTLKMLIHRNLQRIGFDVRRYQPNYISPDNIKARRLKIITANKIDVVLDVGANTGQYAQQELRNSGYKGKIISFEPLSAAYKSLSEAVLADPLWECKNLALSDSEGETVINIAGNSVSSSLLPMLVQHTKTLPDSGYTGTEQIKTVRLDTLRYEVIQQTDCVYLKLDVQGYEMQVLKGAKATLEQVQVVEMELSLVPLYADQVLFRQMLDYMEALNFSLVSLEPGFIDVNTGYVLQADGIFVRNQITPALSNSAHLVATN